MANDMDVAPAGSGAMRGMLYLDPKGKLKAPKNIVQTATNARMLYYKSRAQHLPRIDLYSMIEGLIAGNPPYNPADLQTHGLSHIANFNNGDGRAFYERAALALWNLLNAAEWLCTFNIKGVDHEEKTKWEDILNSNWDEMVREWENYERQENTNSAQLIKFGYSPVLWTDEHDWRWKTVEVSRFFVPDQASTDLSQLTYLCVESNFTAQYLWEVYENLKDVPKGENPWNLEALGRFLLHRANSFLKQENIVLTMMDLQSRLQNRDLLYDSIFSDEIRLVTMLYQEYGKKVTHFIFDRTYESEFLFKADDIYDKISDALVLFTASPGEFTIHANRGVGHKIFSPCQATMQIDCDMVNMVRLGSTPFIRSLNTGSQDFSPIRVVPGVVTNIGNAEFVQNNLAANIQPVVGVGQYILQKLNINTANSGDDPGTADRNQGSISPSEAKMKSTKEFGLLKHNVHHYYSKHDIVWKNMLKRVLNSKKTYPGYDLAKKFKDNCIQEGLPPQFFDLNDDGTPKFLRIKSTRVAGDGSTLASIMGLEAFAPLVSSLPEKGVKEYQRRAVIAYFGKDDISAFLPTDSVADEQAGGASLAGVENAVMQTGQAAIFSPDNNQRAHIVTHIALGSHIIESLQQQQMDAIQADKIFTQLVPHGNEHMQYISQNPLEAQFYQQVRKPWEQIFEYARLNKKNAGAMLQKQLADQQKAQQETQQVLSDEERKNVKLQGDEARANTKVTSQVQRADRANETRAEIMRDKVVKDTDNQRLKIQLEHQVKQSEANGKNEDDIRQQIADMNGKTPAPFDFETPQ